MFLFWQGEKGRNIGLLCWRNILGGFDNLDGLSEKIANLTSRFNFKKWDDVLKYLHYLLVSLEYTINHTFTRSGLSEADLNTEAQWKLDRRVRRRQERTKSAQRVCGVCNGKNLASTKYSLVLRPNLPIEWNCEELKLYWKSCCSSSWDSVRCIMFSRLTK